MPLRSTKASVTPWTSPIFRWAGSKRKLLPKLMSCVPPKYSRYIEPFAGSACLFFALHPSDAVLGDRNAELISAYSTIRSHPRRVHNAATRWPVARDFYYELRDGVQVCASPIIAAARFSYLNRYCFNGVFRTNRAGRFNVPLGTGTGGFPSASQFYRCSIALRNAVLRPGDFARCLDGVEKDDFVYLDPPYAKRRGRFRGEYGYGAFAVGDIKRLLRVLHLIDQRGAKFLLSYCYCEEIRPALVEWHCRALLVRRHVAGFARDRRRVKEVLIANYSLA